MDKDRVRDLFDSISKKYDITNSIISLGLESIWRRQFLKKINNSDGEILDICCGTGTSTYQIWLKAKRARVSGIDFSDGMIDIARSKYRENPNLVFYSGDAGDLEFADDTFDCITIAFGIRNILERGKALREFHRVAKNSGRIIILEFNYIKKGFFRYLYKFYLNRVMPFIGGFITGDRRAYKYLTETIKDFPDPENFKRLMGNAGWKSVEHLPLTCGICNIFIGYKEPVREPGPELPGPV
ncbi:MAG: bifunctional demethylmenaquinone methyltransferase/2-methoxy-6-polyprenyl-1,4-benzoquinol methylase UbiE [Actinomycetia bacterium]|nr:bifunctional demethylmenaquinone methyltransferase/2-methoxy-6-polyprenyl-1,4-benzoquinol methylase UbiE [Actinomycetes bacterium]